MQQIDFTFIDDGCHVRAWISILWSPQDLQFAHVALIVFVVDGDRSNWTYNRIIRLDDAIHFLEQCAAFGGTDRITGLIRTGCEGMTEQFMLEDILRQQPGLQYDQVILQFTDYVQFFMRGQRISNEYGVDS